MVSANPTGPITVAAARNGAYGDSIARLLEFAGHEVEREYYYNDAGAQMERFRASVEARRRGEEPPEDGYQGAYVAELAASRATRCRAMLEQIEATLERFRIHFDSWALQSELEERLPELLPRLDTYEKDGALWARSSAYGDDEDRVLIRSPEQGGGPTYRAADIVYLVDKLERGFDRGDLRARRRPPRHAQLVRRGRAHARLRPRARRGAPLPARPPHARAASRRRCRSGAATSSSSTSSSTRSASTPRAGTSSTAAPTRRSRSTSTSPRRRSQKNPVYYVQYAHARIAGILRNAGDAAGRRPSRPGRWRPRSGSSLKRLLDFPRVVAEAAERRGPQAIPTYAIRVADDFHRFYHEHRVLGSGERQAFRLALVRARRSAVIARAASTWSGSRRPSACRRAA